MKTYRDLKKMPLHNRVLVDADIRSEKDAIIHWIRGLIRKPPN